jgi:hypothetical protein
MRVYSIVCRQTGNHGRHSPAASFHLQCGQSNSDSAFAEFFPEHFIHKKQPLKILISLMGTIFNRHRNHP